MEIIGIVFCNSLKLDIIKFNNILYCGECLFIYDTFEQAQIHNVKMTRLDELPRDCIIKFFDYRIK